MLLSSEVLLGFCDPGLLKAPQERVPLGLLSFRDVSGFVSFWVAAVNPVPQLVPAGDCWGKVELGLLVFPCEAVENPPPHDIPPSGLVIAGLDVWLKRDSVPWLVFVSCPGFESDGNDSRPLANKPFPGRGCSSFFFFCAGCPKAAVLRSDGIWNAGLDWVCVEGFSREPNIDEVPLPNRFWGLPSNGALLAGLAMVPNGEEFKDVLFWFFSLCTPKREDGSDVLTPDADWTCSPNAEGDWPWALVVGKLGLDFLPKANGRLTPSAAGTKLKSLIEIYCIWNNEELASIWPGCKA